MSGIFEPVEMKWRGKDYTIPSRKVLQAIARVEDIITLEQLNNGTRIPLAKLAMAYGTLLRFAGAAQASDDDVYAALFGEGGTDVANQVNMLLSLMIPKKVQDDLLRKARELAQTNPEGGDQGNVDHPTEEGS